MHQMLVVLALLAAAALAQAPLAAQHTDHAARADEAYPLYDDLLGDLVWPVSASAPRAQEYFDQGVRLMYAFTPADARRSFQEAHRLDPECAMCWWGEAWSLGPYLNGPMDDANAEPAHAAAQRAKKLADRRGTPLERALTNAMAARYAPTHGGAGRKGLDSAYVVALEDVYARFGDDLGVATLYADALMLLEPRRGVWHLSKPSIPHIHGVLERVLARDVGHPGACHLYIHATETNEKAGAAQTCSDLLRTSVPGASHLEHMPSHIYNRVGRWGDATAVNVVAVRSDRKAEYGKGFAIYPSHNRHMLLFSASVDGQSAVALQAARDYARMVPTDGEAYTALVLTRFGRFREVLDLTTPPDHPVHRGLWSFARGHAHLRLGQVDSARAYLARVDSLAEHGPRDRMFRVFNVTHLLPVAGGILRAEILRAEDRTDEAIATLEAAVTHEDALQYDEPEPIPFAARDWLGAALLERGRAADAEHVFRAALDDRPHNGWSYLGLEQALRAQGRDADADAARADFERVWVRAGVWIPAARF